jgi:hypothetical protein
MESDEEYQQSKEEMEKGKKIKKEIKRRNT